MFSLANGSDIQNSLYFTKPTILWSGEVFWLNEFSPTPLQKDLSGRVVTRKQIRPLTCSFDVAGEGQTAAVATKCQLVKFTKFK
jgi:hypothetical protein